MAVATPTKMRRSPHSFKGKVEGKVCTHCALWKSLDSYTRRPGWDGLEPRCRDCRRKQQRTTQNGQDYRETTNKRNRERLKVDEQFKMKMRLGGILNRAFRSFLAGKSPGKRVEELLGCPFPQFIAHIEGLFTSEMSWGNYGVKGWEFDHIRPYTSFDLMDDAQVAACCHYTNVQPLWWDKNLAKSNH